MISAAYATTLGRAGDIGTLRGSMSLVKLSDAEIAAKLESLPEWSQPGEEIQRTYRFRDFVAAMAFVEEIASYAEAVQHHPDILIRYSRVTLSLSTHDAGGITDKDFDFAAKADAIAAAAGVK
jgi:4a-hydroxytetrahydrobiopterin dehydratase